MSNSSPKNSTFPAAIGCRLKACREARGWSLQQVADLAGCTKSHVWELEQGRSRNPTINMLIGMSQAFGVSLSELLGEPTGKPRVRGDLAHAISAVNEIWQRAWQAGFDAGKAESQKPARVDGASNQQRPQ